MYKILINKLPVKYIYILVGFGLLEEMSLFDLEIKL